MQESSGKRSLSQRWEDYQVTKTQTFWIAVAGIVATLILGFGVGGWVTGGTAREMVSTAAGDARHQLAAAVCVEEFMGAENVGARLQKLKDANDWERGDVVAAGGWATMPDKKEPNATAATLCASKLAEVKVPTPGSATQTSTAAN